MTASKKIIGNISDVKEFVEQIKRLERSQKRNVRDFYQKSIVISSMKASVYVMVYNAVESSIREILGSIRQKMQDEGTRFEDASDFWRLDAVQTEFIERLQNGTNFGNVLVDFVALANKQLSWDDKKVFRLPFSGNFGQSSARRLMEDLCVGWAPPERTLGGVDLENVRERRNALAHGLETFPEAGSKVTADDLMDALKRIEKFMASYLDALESYRESRSFIRQRQFAQYSGQVHQENADLSGEAQRNSVS